MAPKAVVGQYADILAIFPRVAPKEVETGKVFGKGRFKSVYKGSWQGKDCILLKYMAKPPTSPSKPKAAAKPKAGAAPEAPKPEPKDEDENELKINTMLSEREGNTSAIPTIWGVIFEPKCTTIVQEICPWGSLKDLITHADFIAKGQNLHKLHVMAQVSRALQFLTVNRIIHADLSCRNVLIGKFEEDPLHPDGCILAKVSDFGLSIMLEGTDDFIKLQQPQATRWCAPETVQDYMQSWRADMWALGATLWEMYAGGTAPWPLREKRASVGDRLRALAALAKTRHAEGAPATGGEEVAEDFPRCEGCPEIVHDVILSTMECDEWLRPTYTALAETCEGIISTGGEKRPPSKPAPRPSISRRVSVEAVALTGTAPIWIPRNTTVEEESDCDGGEDEMIFLQERAEETHDEEMQRRCVDLKLFSKSQRMMLAQVEKALIERTSGMGSNHEALGFGEVASVQLRITNIDFSKLQDVQKDSIRDRIVRIISDLASVPKQRVLDLQGKPSSVSLRGGSVLADGTISLPTGKTVFDVSKLLSKDSAVTKFEEAAKGVRGIKEACTGPVVVGVSVRAEEGFSPDRADSAVRMPDGPMCMATQTEVQADRDRYSRDREPPAESRGLEASRRQASMERLRRERDRDRQRASSGRAPSVGYSDDATAPQHPLTGSAEWAARMSLMASRLEVGGPFSSRPHTPGPANRQTSAVTPPLTGSAHAVRPGGRYMPLSGSSRGMSPGATLLAPAGISTPGSHASYGGGQWTLCYLQDRSVLRQHFASEAEAQSAFQMHKVGGPCILRDPRGTVANSISYVPTVPTGVRDHYYDPSFDRGYGAPAVACRACATPPPPRPGPLMLGVATPPRGMGNYGMIAPGWVFPVS